MKAAERETRRKKRILDHAVESGNVAKTCRYFGIPRSSFYRWRNVYLEYGEEGLRSKKPIAKSHPNHARRGGATRQVSSIRARPYGTDARMLEVLEELLKGL